MHYSGALRRSTAIRLGKSIALFALAALLVIHVGAVFAAEGEEGGGGITVIPDMSIFIQIINFLILIWLLNAILYKPIRNILIQRKEKISGLEQSIGNAEAKTLEQDETFSNGIKEARSKGLAQKESLLQQALDEEKEMIDKINLKAQTELSNVHEQITIEVTEAKESLLKEVDGFAKAIGEKILGRAF